LPNLTPLRALALPKGANPLLSKNALHSSIDLPCMAVSRLKSVNRQKWGIWTVGDYSNEYEGFPIDERTKEIAWSNVVKCGNCGGTRNGVHCNPGKTEVIFEKEFTNVCNGTDSLAMRFVNPDAEALECAKKWLR